MRRTAFPVVVFILSSAALWAQDAPKPAPFNPNFPFAAVGDFSDGLAAVAVLKPDPANPDMTVEAWGFLDPAGKWAVKPAFAHVRSFHGGLAAAAIVEPARTEKVPDITGGTIIVNVDPATRWGAIDRSGKWALKPVYEAVGDFSDGLIPCNLKFLWGYVDKTDSMVVKFRFVAAEPFSEGLAAVKIEVMVGNRPTKLWGYINHTGAYVVEPRFDEAGAFSKGKAVATRQGTTFLVDKSGAVTEASAADLAALKRTTTEALLTPFRNPDGKWGYADARGKTIVRPQFDEARPFVNGWAAVGLKDPEGRMHFGLVSKAGTFLKPPAE